MYKDLFSGLWSWAHFLIIPLQERPLSNITCEIRHLETLMILLKTHPLKQMSTATSATLPVEGGSETQPSPSDTTFQGCTCNLILARAFEVVPNALPAEEQQQVSVHLFPGKSDGKGLELPELGWSLHLYAPPSHTRSGQDSFLQLQSWAQLRFNLTAGVKKLNLTAIKNTLSGPMPVVSLPFLYRI